MHLLITLVTVFTVRVRANLYQECAKLYNPGNYMNQLPSLRLPYLGDVPIPNNIPTIKPSPVVKMKTVKVVTTYIYKNPVCVKYSKNKGMCKQDNAPKHKGTFEKLVTKEYFVRDRKGRSTGCNRHKREFEEDDNGLSENENLRNKNTNNIEVEEDNVDNSNYLQTSEINSLSKQNRKTPALSDRQLEHLLIEDRLDQLETILPHYTRRRTYETSTITVTKVLSNQRTMATLVVKNCIPYGYELCAATARKRKSKVARQTDNTNDLNEKYFFG